MKSRNVSAILLAAGKGVRFRSNLPKVMHNVLDKPMIYYPIRALINSGIDDIVLVLGSGKEIVKEFVVKEFGENRIRFVVQRVQAGTGDAVKIALPYIKNKRFLLLYGDMPLIDESVVKGILDNYSNSELVLTSFITDNRYGRVVRDKNSDLHKTVEEKDATPEEKKIKEVNAGLYLVNIDIARKYIKRLKNDNVQKEYYFPDIFSMAIKDGYSVKIYESEKESLLGANNRVELSILNKILQERINRKHMLSGVTIINPESVIIGVDVSIGQDTIIYPDVLISKRCKIGSNVIIERGVIISDSEISDGVHIKPYCHIEKAKVASGAILGPFARLRPDTIVDEGAHIGNFVELKKTYLGKGSKANHLTYLGDAEIGSGVNIGAGTITCNYDGTNKYKTVLSDGVFVGSDTQFVAPVSVGKNSYIGAGSTITEDVPAYSLSLSRVPQKNIPDWVRRKKKK